MIRRPSRSAVYVTSRGDLAPRRSNAAIPLTVGVMVLGIVLASFSVLLTVLLGLVLLTVSFSFLSTRLNPFSVGFYLTTKPSWFAIGVLFLSAIALLYIAYAAYAAHRGPLIP